MRSSWFTNARERAEMAISKWRGVSPTRQFHAIVYVKRRLHSRDRLAAADEPFGAQHALPGPQGRRRKEAVGWELNSAPRSALCVRRFLSLRRTACSPLPPQARGHHQPGGSIRDDEVIAAADDSLVFHWDAALLLAFSLAESPSAFRVEGQRRFLPISTYRASSPIAAPSFYLSFLAHQTRRALLRPPRCLVDDAGLKGSGRFGSRPCSPLLPHRAIDGIPSRRGSHGRVGSSIGSALIRGRTEWV